MEYGIQLYGVRDLAEKSLEEAVKQVAELGYASVEFAGFFGRTPEQITKMLDGNNITVSGTHSSFDHLINEYEDTVAYHKAVGNKYFIIPGYSLSSQQKIDYFVENANVISKKLAKDGITLAFHNHSKEFIPNADGSVAFEQILYRTDIALEVDTYWAYVGMGDPIAVLERVGDRLIAIHIKDGDSEGNGTPLGMGTAPTADVYNWALSHNIPLVVESETCNPSGIEEARICIEYLKSLEK